MSLLDNPFNPMATFESQNTISSISSLDPKLTRTNYYDGRLLKASDLTRDQYYLDERLREVGRAIGQGIVKGLHIQLTAGKKILVSPGLAVTPSGRVLELESHNISLNLMDAAFLSQLNPGHRSLEAGFYAVVAQYAESPVGSAEIYPRNLDEERSFHFNAYAEGLSFALVKLPVKQKIPSGFQMPREEKSIYLRSLLVKDFILKNPGQLTEIGEDSVALGLIGVENGIPQWLDKGLLRRPFRNTQTINYLQTDLYSHYEELLADILIVRQKSANQSQFLINRYFSILPPVGTVPKNAIDPINAYQNFFPEKFEVSISPVREDDVDSIIQQSMFLEPIDFRVDTDVDIMIAVVLDDVSFSFVARKLQHLDKSGKEFILPQHMDEMFLHAFSNKSALSEDNVSVWTTIWESAKQVFYVRRPIRVAETQVSAVVLASGDFAELKKVNISDVKKITSLQNEKLGLNQEISALQDKLEESEQHIKDLVNEINKPKDQRLKEANEKIQLIENDLEQAIDDKNGIKQEYEAAIKTANDEMDLAILSKKKSEEKLSALQKELENALDKIKQLQENSSDSDDKDVQRLQEQIKTLSDQMAKLQQILIKIIEDNEINVDQLSFVAKIRRPGDDKSVESMKNVIQIASNDSALQKNILELIAYMPPAFDDLNWLSLQFIVDSKISEKVVDVFRENSESLFSDVILKIAENFTFPEDLATAWKRAIEKPFAVTPRFSVLNIDSIKTLKTAQLLPASLDINDQDRAVIKAFIAADSGLLKPLSQLKALVDDKYQSALWASLPIILENDKLVEFVDFILLAKTKSLPLGVTVAASNNRFKLSSSMRNTWAELDLT